MARARNIKPGFFKNEHLAECEYGARLLFAGLWCLADREGRLEDRPMRIKADLFPYESVPIDKWLNDLQKHGFIVRYEVKGTKYIQILNFKKHQNPHVKEGASTIPAPGEHASNPADSLIPDSLIPDSLIPDSPNSSSGSTPDPEPPSDEKPKNAELKAKATEVLEFLNSKTGRNYQAVNGTLKPLMARLREGFTVTQCRQVIAKKARDWAANEKMEPYLRPKTLFAQENFANYIGELEVIDEQHD